MHAPDHRTVLATAALLAFSLGSLGAPGAARAALEPGAKAPDFSARATLGGKEYDASLAAMLRQGPVVLYFYPAAFTSGCTVEAHDFAAAMPEFRSLGAQVLGISEDKIEKLDRFSVSECQSKFPVAADNDGQVAHAYKATMPVFSGYASRTSYAIAPDGTVLAVYSALNPDQHVSKMMDAIKAYDLKTGRAATPSN